MASNEILPFAGGGAASVETQASYLADAQRLIGNQPGIARHTLVNKAMRQSSLVATAVAQFIATRQATDVVDTLTPAQIELMLSTALSGNGTAILNVSSTANALVANFTPAATTRLLGVQIAKALATNTTTTPTLARDAQAALPIVKGNNLPLVAGDILSGALIAFFYDAALNKEVLINPATGVVVNQPGRGNILFNADFRINQRSYVSAAVLASAAYGHDRFKAGASGGDYSFTQLNSSTQITIAAGKSLIQVVEDRNVVGGSYVLSWTGTALGRAGVNSATPSGTYVASPLLITGQTAGTVMSIELNAGTVNTVQLELGTVATPFERRTIGLELNQCKRYFRSQAMYWQGSSPGLGPGQGWTWYFETPMRAVPTITSSNVIRGNSITTFGPQTVNGCGMYAVGDVNGMNELTVTASAEL